MRLAISRKVGAGQAEPWLLNLNLLIRAFQLPEENSSNLCSQTCFLRTTNV